MTNAALYPHFVRMEGLIAFAIILQVIEFLQIRTSFSERGIWAWSAVRGDFAKWPWIFRRFFDGIMNERGFTVLLIFELICAVLSPFLGSAWIAGFLLLGAGLVSLRWRGTFNGGSDYMTIVVLSAVFIARFTGGETSPFLLASMGYVAFQVALSFFVAGIAKLRVPSWRNGEALTGFLRSSYYGTPPSIRVFTQSRPLMRMGSGVILLFECGFPLCFLVPELLLPAIALAIIFQLGNAFAFGLNRFVWAWAAAYPAFYAVGSLLALKTR